MMNQGKSFLKRFFALVMALALLVSGSNLGAVLQVSAAGSATYVNVGKLVADNYELTDAEEALLSSGYLAGETISYTAPTNEDGLVTVDNEKKTITAEEYKGWIPTIARIKVGTEVIESIALDGGKGTYTYDKNAFSVEVDYIYDVKVAVADQERLLNSVAWLKNGVANLNAVAAQAGNLYIMEQAMPALVDFAKNGVDTPLGPVGLEEECEVAVNALDQQMTANGGLLNLSVMIKAYNASNKVEYLLKNGANMKAEVAVFAENIKLVSKAVNDVANDLELFIEKGWIAAEDAENITLLADITALLNNEIAAVNAADWTAAEMGTALVSDTVDYAKLNELVAALGELTPMPAIKETLHVADTTLTVNMSMFTVTVKVALAAVEGKADSNNLVPFGTKEVVITLAEGATAEEILAAVAENGVEAEALASWADTYVAEHFAKTESALPEALTKDITFEISYAPKTYTITGDLGEKEVYYGYQLTLPAHDNPEQAYDYTVNGQSYAQGEIVVITGDTEVKRTSGKAYTSTDLYKVVSDNYGNQLAKDILQSGALKDNTVINVRKPDPADAASLLKLLDGDLTAKPYFAAYEGLSWAPYTYNGNLFNGANTVPFSGKEAKVQYKLELTNFTVAQVQAVLDLAVALKSEANAQKATLDAFAANYDTMGQLDNTKLGALNGVISVTDFTPGDGTKEDAENLRLRNYFTAVVGKIIEEHVDPNEKLKIYNMLGEYNKDGLRYYYNNAEAFIAEINAMAGYLSDLVDEEEALRIMVSAAGFPEYADKISGLEESMAAVTASLTMPNAAIDLTSPYLGKLLAALEKDEKVVVETAGYAYLISDELTALDESSVMVQIIINTPAGTATVATKGMDRGTVLDAATVAGLKAEIEAKVAGLIGDTTFYALSTSASLDALVNTAINANVNIYYDYTAKEYTVKIDGEADQTISINDLEINLPKHTTPGYVYRYTIDGVSEITNSAYTFTAEQVARLFVDGTYTITRVEINEAAEKLEAAFEKWAVKDENGNIIALNAAIAGSKEGLMDFVMTLTNAGFSYIGLNGEDLLYLSEKDNALEISLQTLLNAILNDNSFGSNTLIELGNKGNGKMFSAQMQLGGSKNDENMLDIPFTLTLTSVPGKMATVANGLNTIKPYMSFNANNGVMDFNINLPEKVYEIYLAALMATGNVDMDNMEAVNSEIAFQFLYGYIEYILATDATTASFSNTLKMLGQSYDLTGYEEYYQMVKKAMTSEGVQINADRANGEFEMVIAGGSQKAINALINLLGVDVTEYQMYLGMIKEYKYADAKMGVSARANLDNTDSGFEAMLLDLNASGVANKFDFTKDLPGRCKSIAGTAAVILVSDIDGDLVFNGTTILDLNGQTVNGNIVANGNVIIIDSAFDTYNGGLVNGNVSGKATIVGGNYSTDVSAFLKNGYKLVNGAVQNVLFTVETNGDDLTYVINTNFLNDPALEGYIPDAKSLAVEIAMDLVLNYYTAAAITADGNTIYNLHIDDLLALYASSNKTDDLIQAVLDCVNLPELSNFANIILEDLLDFDGIADALENNESVATYAITTAPWALNLKHQTNGDYITVGFGANNKVRTIGKSFNVSLKFAGANKDKVVAELRELGEITEGTYAKIDLQQPVYDGATNSLKFVGSAEAHAELILNEKDVYANILALILANGNPDAKAELVSAVNSGDRAALKDAIDKMTVADLIAAMKALNRNESFEDIAAKLGVTADVSKDTDLEKAAHLLLTALGKALEKMDITGMNSNFGALDKDGDGVYEFSADATRNPSASAGGYTFYVEATAKVSATVKLFGDTCLWGDVDHDGDVDIADAEYAMMKALGAELAIDYCMKRGDVDCDGKITVFDAEYIMMYALGAPVVFPAVH